MNGWSWLEKERGAICEISVNNTDNPSHGTPGGRDMTDKVFLLSVEEAERYFDSGEARQCKAGRDALETECLNGFCGWWLRSLGGGSKTAASVHNFGTVNDWGPSVCNAICAVRPALWVDHGSLNR